MDPLLALVVVAALIAGASVLGLLWRAGQGRIRRSVGGVVAIDGVELGHGVTLLQFSSEYCAPCRSTARVLEELTHDDERLTHVELDVAERPELAARFGILQTPTTLVLDEGGRIHARIGGAVRRDLLVAELAKLTVAA